MLTHATSTAGFGSTTAIITGTNTLNAKTPGVGEEIYEKYGFNRSESVSGTTLIYHAGNKLYTGSEDPESEASSTPSGLIIPSRRAVRGLTLR